MLGRPVLEDNLISPPCKPCADIWTQDRMCYPKLVLFCPMDPAVSTAGFWHTRDTRISVIPNTIHDMSWRPSQRPNDRMAGVDGAHTCWRCSSCACSSCCCCCACSCAISAGDAKLSRPPAEPTQSLEVWVRHLNTDTAALMQAASNGNTAGEQSKSKMPWRSTRWFDYPTELRCRAVGTGTKAELVGVERGCCGWL